MTRRPRLSYANVMSTLALCVALGGTGYAAAKIDGGEIMPGTVKGKALKKGSVAGSKLKPDAVKGSQVKEASLAEVPAAKEAATLGGRSAAQLTDACAAGTRLYAGACIEDALRNPATWPDAAEICGDVGRRMPTLDELEGFRSEPGITLGNYEHVSLLIDVDGQPNDTDGYRTIGINDSGGISTGFDYGNSNAAFRCVAPLTNR